MISDYRKFLESEYAYRRLSLYERLCNFFDKIKIPVPKDLKEKYQNEINFCHLRVTPNGILSLAIFLPFIIFFSLISIFFVFNLLSESIILLTFLLFVMITYYLFTYTSFLVKYFRSSAATEMTSAIIYMAISMRIQSNLETAVAFTAQNLSGTLGLDFKKILWDLETGKIISVTHGIDEIAKKWRSESEEFVDALSLLKTSINEPDSKMISHIDEAVKIMIKGTKARMKEYVLLLKTPLRILNAFGILMPMLGLIFFPLIVIFIPEIAKAELLAFSYIILLPSIVYMFLKQYFYAKPYSYHHVDVSKIERYKKSKRNFLLISAAIPIILLPIFVYKLSIYTSIFSFEQFLYSYMIIFILSSSIALYSLLSTLRYLKENKEILDVENELPTVIYQLSITSTTGKPIEKNIEEIIPKIETLKISKMLKKIISNIKMFGKSFDSAVFDEKIGAINFYPSKTIEMTMRLIVDVSKKGSMFLSMALKSVSNFFRDEVEVSKMTEEILSDTISDMEIQAWVFAPLSAGVVVGLMSIVIYVFSLFGQNFLELEAFLSKSGLGGISMSSFSFLLNIGKQVPFHVFQIIVGCYMVEIVVIISTFLGELKYGKDEINKIFSIGKTILVSLLVYSAIVFGIYFGINAFIQIPEL
ncbi:MAG: hypothetical protein QW423_01230 [Candidatus Aenigmatarchaeota archaeon]